MRAARPSPGDRIVDFQAPCLDGSTFSTRRAYLRTSLLVVFTHEWPCTECRAYLASIGHRSANLLAERCRAVAVVPLGSAIVVPRLEGDESSVTLALAEANELHARYGFVDERGRPHAAVVLADEIGTIWQVWSDDGQHRLPDPDDVLAWVRFLSYQCPECWERPWWDSARQLAGR
ncbi:MAG: redoxin domain-containing protein [Thermomicrobium sp.]|nr:redoxin domain-containing protein [Thermomicrobium sp.]